MTRPVIAVLLALACAGSLHAAPDAAPELACARILRRWAGANVAGGSGECRHAGRWWLASGRTGRLQQTVQLQARGSGSAGFASALDLGVRPKGTPAPRFPVPAGGTVVNVLESSGPDGAVTQFTLWFPFASTATADLLRSGARARRWAIAPVASDRVLDFSQGPMDVRAVVAGDATGSSVVLIEHCAAACQR